MKQIVILFLLVFLPGTVLSQSQVTGNIGSTARNLAGESNHPFLLPPIGYSSLPNKLEVKLWIDLGELLIYSRKRRYRMPIFVPRSFYYNLPVVDYSDHFRYDLPIVKPGDRLGETATSFSGHHLSY